MSAKITGAPVWVELNTTDAAKAEAFYSALLGWRFHQGGPEYGGYRIIMVGDQVVGGGMQIDPERMRGVKDGFALYLDAVDINATDARIQSGGGEVLFPPTQIMDQGKMAFYRDPQGAGFGTWQGQEMPGVDKGETHGLSLWYELMTNDYDAACRFYTNALGFDLHPMDGMEYATVGAYEESVAGIGDASGWPGAERPHWQVYFHVDDTDAACAKVTELGGKVLDGPADTPHGRIATVTDDQGALFLLVH